MASSETIVATRRSSPSSSIRISRSVDLPAIQCLDPDAVLVSRVSVDCSINRRDENTPPPRASGSVDISRPVETHECIVETHDIDVQNHDLFAIPPRPEATDDEVEDASPTKVRQPFHKWVKTLRRRHAGHHMLHRPRLSVGSGHSEATQGSSHRYSSNHCRNSSSESSFAFVAATKSASVSLASASIIGRSRRTTQKTSRAHSRADRSSHASITAPRFSDDSRAYERPPHMDPEVLNRALQRRRILDELISTEESYIGDIKFLINVYVTILATLPAGQAGLRSSINRNLADMVELHGDILAELHRIVPTSNRTQADPHSFTPTNRPHHQRWRSLDAVPEDKGTLPRQHHVHDATLEPQVAADIANVFNRKMNRFFVYEEYSAKYDSMKGDVTVAHRTMPRWGIYQKGLETLASSLGSVRSQDGSYLKKSLTMSDLLVKPIQRVCKYPLLFAELLKYTPVCDCPYAYMEIESTLVRLREATGAINRATDNRRTKATLEKTWLLQDRLVFPNTRFDAVSKSRIRSFGHVQLCGVLHVCWQTTERVKGSYMICLLYRQWFCLATAGKVDQIYTIQACIDLNTLNVEEIDNGRGLQCHTAPFSWKIVFESDHQLYEVVMSACAPKEELEWKGRLSRSSINDGQPSTTLPIFSFLALDVLSLGNVYGRPGTVARRMSIHRATTVGPKSTLCQVIVRNTSVDKDATTSASRTSINRSQSLLTTNSRVPVLAPSRADRARLEALLADVWSREILPYPGITARSRSEHLVRSSASSVIRKLSISSIASTFTRRSSSAASIHRVNASDEVTTVPASSPNISRSSTRGEQKECTASGTGSVFSDIFREIQDAARSRLSIISDETDKRCATPAPPNAGHEEPEKHHDDLLRRLQKLTMLPQADGMSEIGAAGSAPTTPTRTRKRSLGSLRTRSRCSSFSARRAASAAARFTRADRGHGASPVDVSSPLPSPGHSHHGPASIKSVGKWARAGILHREAVVHGIRSFFR